MSPAREPSEDWPDAVFRDVFLEHYTRVVGVLVRILGDRTRAEELANDVFWRFYRQPLSLRRDGNVGGWLYRVATNVGLDDLRASARRFRYEQAAGRMAHQDTNSSTGPLDDLLREEKCRRVRDVLAAIKPAQAQLLILRASGMSYKELAEALDLKPSGIGTMLIRAEADFRTRHLQLHGDEGGI
jgi:RNA polymerase sigma-70 factor (ECF subfamily)